MIKYLIIFLLAAGFFCEAQKKEVFYLSGKDNRSSVKWDFFCTEGRNSNQWSKIVVPSCWEQQGFGNYDYGRDYYTDGKKFKFSDEQGIYKFKFKVPSNWENKHIQIVFEGVMTDAEVKINGVSAGDIHQGAFYQFRYNITDKLNLKGENELEVKVSKMSANKMVNRAERYADYWIFGGIFRPVFLEAFPQEFIQRSVIGAYADGTYHAKVYPGFIQESRTVLLKIKDSSGKIVSESSSVIRATDTEVDIKGRVAHPLLWTSETPNLYTAEIVLLSKNKILYQVADRIGFRSIEVRKGDGIYLNGTKIKLKGINRHCFWPESGRTLNADIDLLDVKLMREMNMNAIRCSHYPPDQSFLDICDSLGLYVIDELAGWQDAYDTEVGEKLVREMVIRDANHPSIIFWSNGNEGGSNAELDDDFKIWDHTDRVLIRAHHKPGNAMNGIDCNHYEDYYSSRAIMSVGDNIYMPTEFLHCQDDGGGGAGLYDFWEQMWSSDLSGGGFLWVFSDEAIVRTDLNNLLDANRVNANDGVLGPHREKEGSFYSIRDIYTPVKINLDKLPIDFNGLLDVENRFFFTNLKDCRFQVRLINYRHPNERISGHQVVKSYDLKSPDVAPGKKGMLDLMLSEWSLPFDGVLLQAYDNKNEKVAEWSWKVQPNDRMIRELISELKTTSVEVVDSADYIQMKASGIGIQIHKKDGTLKAVKSDFSSPLSLKNGPVLTFESYSLTEIKHYPEPDGHVVEATYGQYMKRVKWKMLNNGWVILEHEYELEGRFPFMGISFDYPEALVISAKWLGRGPYRVWKNRMSGGTIDVWANLYNDTQTGLAPWIYPEFKGYFSDIAWMELSTAEGKFLVASEDENLFVRLFDSYALSGESSHPQTPSGDISFLDCIPPIGTKMATKLSTRTDILGPQSESNRIEGKHHRRLYFYFGVLPTK